MTYYERNKKDILEKRKQHYLSKKNDPEYKEKRKNYQKTYKKLNKDKLTEYTHYVTTHQFSLCFTLQVGQ